MTVEELLVRSAMAYGEASAYADQGTIVLDRPRDRQEFGFTTMWDDDGDFSFVLQGPPASVLPNLEVHSAGREFETTRSGSFGRAATLEQALVPLTNLTTMLSVSVPRILAGSYWGPTLDYQSARIVGVTTMNGQPTIMLELDLIGQGTASVWLDQATLVVRRLVHDSPRNESVVTVSFNRLEVQ